MNAVGVRRRWRRWCRRGPCWPRWRRRRRRRRRTGRSSMPRTMPRSTAQITGWSVATVPNGQWSLMIRSPLSLRCVAGGHVGGEPVGGEGIGDGLHRRPQRPLPGGEVVAGQRRRPSPGRTSRRPPRPSPRPRRGAGGRAPARAAPARGRRCAPGTSSVGAAATGDVALRRATGPAAGPARAGRAGRPRRTRRRRACRGGGGPRSGARRPRPPRPTTVTPAVPPGHGRRGRSAGAWGRRRRR